MSNSLPIKRPQRVYALPSNPGQRHHTINAASGGGGGGDIMEHRVARLEEDVKDIKDTMHRLETVLVRIDERLTHIPSTIALVVIILTVFAGGMAIPQIPSWFNKESKGQTQVTKAIPDESQRSTSKE